MADSATPDEVHRVVSAALDGAFYQAAYPELDQPDIDPIRHYLEHGWREGRDPAPWISVRRYLDDNPDVASAGLEPLYHYLTLGRLEGRHVARSDHAERVLFGATPRGAPPAWRYEPWSWTPPPEAPAEPEPEDPDFTHEERELVAAAFDATFYLNEHPDVRAWRAPPLEHFMRHGWREGRDPSPHFSVRDYLDANPDVAQSGVNPLLHYLTHGRQEGRAPRDALGFRYRLIRHTRSVEERIARAKRESATEEPQSDRTLAAALGRSGAPLRPLHVTFSHDDYLRNVGGVQVCLRRESAQMAELGRDHLHIFPTTSRADPHGWPIVRTADELAPLEVIWNGEVVGVFNARVIARVLAARGAAGGSFAIHSLLGHCVEEVVEILSAARLEAGFFWLHDFASLCAGYHLLRDDVEDCGAPPPDSAACRICMYGPWRARHLAEHARLFDLLDITVVSPSEPALKLWRDSWRFEPAAAIVHPHVRLVPREALTAPAEEREPRPFRLAFIGFPSPHKGWPIFEGLVRRYADDPRYEFLHVGSHPLHWLPAEFHPMRVSPDRPRGMPDMLEAIRADAVLIWPLCRETFSFVAYEAAAAGAAIIAGPDSGNVAAFVEQTGFGRVLPDEATLVAAFASGEIAELARDRRRPARYDLQFSGMSADLLGQDAPA